MSDLDMTEIAVAVGKAIAVDAGKAVVAGGGKAIKGLVEFVRQRLGRTENGAAVLTAVAEDPEAKSGLLAAAMTMEAGLDAEWGRELQRRYLEVSGDNSVGSISMDVSGHDNVVNQVGHAHTVNIGDVNRPG